MGTDAVPVTQEFQCKKGESLAKQERLVIFPNTSSAAVSKDRREADLMLHRCRKME